MSPCATTPGQHQLLATDRSRNVQCGEFIKCRHHDDGRLQIAASRFTCICMIRQSLIIKLLAGHPQRSAIGITFICPSVYPFTSANSRAKSRRKPAIIVTVACNRALVWRSKGQKSRKMTHYCDGESVRLITVVLVRSTMIAISKD